MLCPFAELDRMDRGRLQEALRTVERWEKEADFGKLENEAKVAAMQCSSVGLDQA